MTIQSPAYFVAGPLLFVFKTCATTSEKTAVQTRTRGRSRHIWDVSFFSALSIRRFPLSHFLFSVSLCHLCLSTASKTKQRNGCISSTRVRDKNRNEKRRSVKRLTTLFIFCEMTISLKCFFHFFFGGIFFPPAHGFTTVQPAKYFTDWAQRKGTDQPLNTDPLCLIFMSHFCQVWQPIRLK